MQMKQWHRWLGTAMAIGVIAMTMGMAVPAQAQTTANGPYYATPSWDQTLPAATRFIVLSNFNGEAVLDRETGLVWERSPSTFGTTWVEARFVCTRKAISNRRGWRLPALAELASLLDISVSPPLPALLLGHPFHNVQLSIYWSATTRADNPAIAWDVIMGNGNVDSNFKDFTFLVWCVRGGMNADVY